MGAIAVSWTNHLARLMERHGWELRELDLDFVIGKARVRLHRFDGRWLDLFADRHGRAVVERWHRHSTVTRYRGGAQCDSFEDDFLGRQRFDGARAALRHMTNYLADNPCPGFPALTAGEIRRALAPPMISPK